MGLFRFYYWVNRSKELVITYHNILPDELYDSSVHLGVSHAESVFENHINLIKDIQKNRKILITFDDGYKNQLEVAAKILNKYNLKAIFFITFEMLITSRALLIDMLLMWTSYVPAGIYRIFDQEYKLDNSNRAQVTSGIYEKLIESPSLWQVLESELNKTFEFDKLDVTSELRSLRFEPLNEGDLNELKKQGHSLGAHGWSHKPLATLSGDEQRQEFSLSKKYTDKYCNTKIFSYPYGGPKEVSPQTVSLCEHFGFSAAYMNIPRAPRWTGINSNYVQTRMSLPNCKNRFVLHAKLSGFEGFLKRACCR